MGAGCRNRLCRVWKGRGTGTQLFEVAPQSSCGFMTSALSCSVFHSLGLRLCLCFYASLYVFASPGCVRIWFWVFS